MKKQTKYQLTLIKDNRHYLIGEITKDMFHTILKKNKLIGKGTLHDRHLFLVKIDEHTKHQLIVINEWVA